MDWNSIPKTIELTDEIEVRGEILCTYENFEQLKNTMEKMGLRKTKLTQKYRCWAHFKKR